VWKPEDSKINVHLSCQNFYKNSRQPSQWGRRSFLSVVFFMKLASLKLSILSWLRRASVLGLSAVLIFCFSTPAWAALDDDRYDGDIFALYGGNGSLIPPKVKLADSLANRNKATLLVLYTDDSRDAKQYSITVSQLQGLYGRVIDILAIRADSLLVKAKYDSTEPGYYFKGFVPQTVIFNQAGNVKLNETGNVDFEKLDDTFRQIFDLLPRSQSVTLKRRAVNEINTELVQE
jgi:hypothetical protein